MRINTRFWSLTGAGAVLGLFISINSAETASLHNTEPTALPAPTPAAGANNNVKVSTSGGLTTAIFQGKSGRVVLILPDDMRAGDTISGTVSVEPDGKTDEERAKNRDTFNDYVISVLQRPAPNKPEEGVVKIPVSKPSFTIRFPQAPIDPAPPGGGFQGFNITLSPPITQVGGNPQTVTSGEAIGSFTIEGGTYSIPIPVVSGGQNGQPLSITIPEIGQQGRTLVIPGAFDGDSSNTSLNFRTDRTLDWSAVRSSVSDFEKNTTPVSGGFGLIGTGQFEFVAESPRQAIFKVPANVVGPVEVLLKEGPTEKSSEFRTVGVRLSAPKTNLMRGERTTLTVEVSGLQGIKDDVPLQLDSKGVITMDGGNFQNLRIKPQEVKQDGTYTTNRAITGQQAGGFTVTATVIVRRFDLSLQDDADPNRIFHFNSFTGDYVFACGGGSCRPGSGAGTGQTGAPTGQTGGTANPPTNPPPPTGLNLTGIGKPTMKGCIITLSHNAPDRRVFARLDACTKTGEASVQTNSPKTDIKITDKNTTDNTGASPPPK